MGKFNVTNEERLWAMLGHLSLFVAPLVAPLILYLVYKDKSRFVAFHALQSLFFQLALIVVVNVLLVLTFIPLFVCFAFPLLILVVALGPVVIFGVVVYPIIAAIRAYNGELFEYWLVGGWAREIVGI